MQSKSRFLSVVLSIVISITGTSIVKPQLNPEKIKKLLTLYKLNGIPFKQRIMLIKKLKQASPSTEEELLKTIIGSFPKKLNTKRTRNLISSNVNNFWGKREKLSPDKQHGQMHEFTITTLLSLLKNTKLESNSSRNKPTRFIRKKTSKSNKQRMIRQLIQDELRYFEVGNHYSSDSSSSDEDITNNY